MPSKPAQPPTDEQTDSGSLLVEDQRFSIVPEWVIDAEIPDSAFRLYTLLLRYGNSSGCRMPSRPTLARRMRRSVDAVDRAMRHLAEAGIVRVEHRRSGQQFLPNRYHLRTSQPALKKGTAEGGRKSAATPAAGTPSGRTSAATTSRISTATLAADLRPDLEALTDKATPPPPSRPSPGRRAQRVEEADNELLERCGIGDLDSLSARCVAIRRTLGRPAARWSAKCLAVAIHLAVVNRGWPARRVEPALLAIARDPETQSPARVAEAGPWWDETILGLDEGLDSDQLAALEDRLAETGGVRPLVQRMAREELAVEGMPLTRSTVAQRACAILDRREAERNSNPAGEEAPAATLGAASDGRPDPEGESQ
jgi:hypothetical protein